MDGNAFDVVLRGYDREEVDTLRGRVAAGDVTADELRKTSFSVTMRGYDRYQVSEYIEDAIAALEGKARMPRLSRSAALTGRKTKSVRLDTVVRGYKREQVDALWDAVNRKAISPDEVRKTTFEVVWNGYERGQVRKAVKEWAEILETPDEE
ncbi:hypothetical protein Pth03_33380 [Planotetraspora thailandica]|uniref:DivIVA domain-containing protein n=1 Tax=Planotetraspora thailandica TaxID=487172 RepID=A0A8J3XW19_9ACTN|nr:DivIVA domain-containing protein [Planotetraspora thailandica]GII54949.1 hypothetical protein Pth03_33380 [Planotetraspora thailandica]